MLWYNNIDAVNTVHENLIREGRFASRKRHLVRLASRNNQELGTTTPTIPR